MSGTSILYLLAFTSLAPAGLYILWRAARLLGPVRSVWRQRAVKVAELPTEGPAETRGRVTLEQGGAAAFGPMGVASAVVRVQITATRQAGKNVVTVGQLLSVLPAKGVLIAEKDDSCELDFEHLALDGERFVWAGSAELFAQSFPTWASQLTYITASRVVIHEERVALGSLVLANGLVVAGDVVASAGYRGTAQRRRLKGSAEQPLVLTHRTEGSYLVRSALPLAAAGLAGALLVVHAAGLAVYRLALVWGL